MAKFFNTEGPVRSAEHYCLFFRLPIDFLFTLFQQKKYFILHAPRQTGKTTSILALTDEINQRGDYRALYVNVEPAQAARGKVKEGIKAVLSRFRSAIDSQFGADDPALKIFDTLVDDPYDALNDFLKKWSRHSDKPLILFIDEIDSLIGDTLISVLRQIRAGYPERPKTFPQSICLIGVRDVKDYQIFSEEKQALVLGGSAFNIKSESLLLPNFTLEEVQNLFEQHTKDTGQTFSNDAVRYVFDQTRGQPWLVNALAYQACFRDFTDRNHSINLQEMEQARDSLIRRRDTHLDVLLDKLNEERVANIIDTILSGRRSPTPFPQADVKYAIDLGLIADYDGVLQIANPIYREIIPRELTFERQQTLALQTASYLTPEGFLDMEKVLSQFTQFFRDNAGISHTELLYKESGPHLVLMAYLQRIVNGGGRIIREYALGKGRIDLLIQFKEQTIVLELKIFRSPKTLEEGLSQTSEYMKNQGATEGHLILFDRTDKPWNEKISHTTKQQNNCTISVWTL